MNAQSISQTGIPKISNNGTSAPTQANNSAKPASNAVSLPRSLYQTHQGGKYNFITPMILSDLHHISSIQQTAGSVPYDVAQLEAH